MHSSEVDMHVKVLQIFITTYKKESIQKKNLSKRNFFYNILGFLQQGKKKLFSKLEKIFFLQYCYDILPGSKKRKRHITKYILIRMGSQFYIDCAN